MCTVMMRAAVEETQKGNCQPAASLSANKDAELHAGLWIADDAASLLQIGAKILECAVVIELKDLNGKAKLGGLPLYVQVQKEGD